eukprot:Nitzschia sp. Nitz4//scaffold32_size149145//66482//69228//NITZ4_002881-RA/size149145-snap-gene-0.18-mRNA-1//-1//CDS//3329548075//5024//frame0
MADEVPTAPLWVWIVLIIIAAVSFWCQATVTEERLVPALNVISEYYHIPNDIAGATLMAAGASSPELFSSIVALFITHSSLGLGTIVGSEIFNQLIICAGAVYASKTGDLVLDKAIVTREVSFYALGIILLYIALQDVRPVDDDPSGEDHIFVSFREACMVFAGYLLYVWVCANMDDVVAFFSKTSTAADSSLTGAGAGSADGYGSINTHQVKFADQVEGMPYLTQQKNLSKEPAKNWKEMEFYMPRESFGSFDEGDEPASIMQHAMGSIQAHVGNAILATVLKHTERPTGLHTVYDLEDNEVTGVVRCFLWQASPFYSRARFASSAWNLRWFTVTDHLVTSVPNRQDAEKHRMQYPRFNRLEVDPERFIIRMINPIPNKRDYMLMAPSKKIFQAVLEKLEAFMKWHTTDRLEGVEPDKSGLTPEELQGEEHLTDNHGTLIEFPADGSATEIFFFVVLFPIRFLMHFTLPDVRHMDVHGDPTSGVLMAFLATFMCLVWLIVGSYAMVASLESLAELMDIPDAVIGFTVSAAGTSLPNYVASKVAAENGFGNQAVSNAFGSNTFNIMVGLGLPWVLYTSFGTGFEPYHGLPAEGILESIIILATVLLVFVVLMLHSGFVLYRWHGVLFALLYVAYIVYAVAGVYLNK